jgi:hypothetical protein
MTGLFSYSDIDNRHAKAPSYNDRVDTAVVYDHLGEPHVHTVQNAGELCRKSGWTADKNEAEKPRVNPVPRVLHRNEELGPNGVLETPRRALGRPTKPGLAYV